MLAFGILTVYSLSMLNVLHVTLCYEVITQETVHLHILLGLYMYLIRHLY